MNHTIGCFEYLESKQSNNLFLCDYFIEFKSLFIIYTIMRPSVIFSPFFVCLLIQALGEYDADVGSPKNNLPSKGISNLPVDSQSLRVASIQLNGKQGHQKASKFEMGSPTILPHCKPHQSMGETPSSMNQGLPLSVAGAESCIEKSINKPANSIFNIKQSKFWGRGSVSCYVLPMHLVYCTLCSQHSHCYCPNTAYWV